MLARKTPLITTKLNLIVPGKAKDVRTTQQKDNTLHILSLILIYAILIFAAIIVIFPFVYMILASFMKESVLTTGAFLPETNNLWEDITYNYTSTLERFSYLKYIGNTLIVGITTTLLCVIVTILSAFAFARLKFRGRDFLFTIFLGTMMIPGEMMVITNYLTLTNLGLISPNQNAIEAYSSMVLPFIASVFYIYLLRQNFMQIPNELYLAAKVDGKSDWSYLWKVMVPLAAPTLITVCILSLIGSWNAYVWPRQVTLNTNFWVISVAVRGEALTRLDPTGIRIPMSSWQMCASVLTVVPLLILFIIFRKYIMSGTGRAGIKG